MESQLDKIIRINIDNEIITVFSLRARQKISNTNCIRLINGLIDQLAPTQLPSVIKRYPQPIIILDDIINCFNYHGEDMNSDEKRCICGTNIEHNHIIKNRITNKVSIIGSTCCYQWRANSHVFGYKPKARHLILKQSFEALKSGYYALPKINFGKYEGMSINRLVGKDPRYCNWLISNNIFRTVEFTKYLKETLDNFQYNQYLLSLPKCAYLRRIHKVKLNQLQNIIEYIRNPDLQKTLQFKFICKTNNI